MEELSVKLEAFEGPMDLLLHLIHKNKIDIYDIPIAVITTQYMDYMNHGAYDMEHMSEFIKMAATLLEIKARLLLPKLKVEEEAEEDPRKDLVEKLLEYKLCKFMSEQLSKRADLGTEVFYSKPHIPDEILKYVPPIDTLSLLDEVTLSRLQEVFQHVISRKANRLDPIRHDFKQVEKDEVTIEDRMDYILTFLDKKREIFFSELFDTQTGRFRVIVTFLAMLELIKINRITVMQNAAFTDIIINKT